MDPTRNPEASTGPDASSRTSRLLSETEIQVLSAKTPAWEVKSVDGTARLERVFHLPDYPSGLGFVSQLEHLAETAHHHPVILTELGRVTVNWWTFSAGGLTAGDFVMAEKTDRLFAMLFPDQPE